MRAVTLGCRRRLGRWKLQVRMNRVLARVRYGIVVSFAGGYERKFRRFCLCTYPATFEKYQGFLTVAPPIGRSARRLGRGARTAKGDSLTGRT